jgi:3,2-trans-enoyl-CoA isomerase
MGQLLVRTIGFRQAELALALGTLFPPEQALSVGLVDDIVPHQQAETGDDILGNLLPSQIKDQALNPLLHRAYTQARIYAKIPPQARVASKMVTREEHIFRMIAKRDEDTQHFCGFVTQKAVQKNLTAYVEALKNKSTKK